MFVAVERVGHGTPMVGPTPGSWRGRPPVHAASASAVSSEPTSPPSDWSASSASSRVSTAITSTSSPTASRTSSSSSDGHEEHLVARVSHGDAPSARRRPPARPAVEVHRAGDGDLVAPGELPRGEHVEDGQREGQTGRRSADGRPSRWSRRSGSRTPTMRSSGSMPMMARVGVVGRRDGRHVHVDAGVAPRRSLDRQRVRCPGTAGLEEVADLAGLVDGLPVDGHDDVVELQRLGRGRVLGDAAHDRAGRGDRRRPRPGGRARRRSPTAWRCPSARAL